MPPGPAYNWYCVANSVLDVLSQAARIRATQLEQQSSRVLTRGSVRPTSTRTRKREEYGPNLILLENALTNVPSDPVHTVEQATIRPDETQNATPEERPPPYPRVKTAISPLASSVLQPLLRRTPGAAEPLSPERASVERELAVDPPATIPQDRPCSAPVVDSTHEQTAPLSTIQPAQPTMEVPTHTALSIPERTLEHTLHVDSGRAELVGSSVVNSSNDLLPPVDPVPRRALQSSKVPSSRLGRLFHYGGLAASLGYGAASELLRRSATSSDQQQSSLMLTEGNIKRLVSKLTKMRGAALKLGQFMSIQDSHVLPPEVEDIFRRVQDSAHYMPDWQMEEVMTAALGPSWMDNFTSFDRVPFAAASIGQVHSALLAAERSPTGKEEAVAVKIQFPNIVNSIESDLGYVKLLLTAGRLLPKGLFLDRTIQVMKEELADECDYQREASFLRRFGSPDFLGDDARFKVPWVWSGSTARVLVMQRVGGVSVGGAVIERLSQDDRNEIATRIIELCLKELFEFRAMQTDPNWTNFLWNDQTKQVELVDFGATREYSKEFIDHWLKLLQAAATDDRQACIEWSLKVGYLTGDENETMLDAHVNSMSLLATPFKSATPQPFAFGPGSTWADVTTKIREQIPVMLQHRLTPPPRETYSLNRKLSGAFLLAARLNAEVDCGKLWQHMIEHYKFETEKP